MFKVLIIDDSPFTLHRHSELATEAGLEVLVAKNGEEAIALFEKCLPQIVLCDVMMPEMDGYDVLESLKSCHPGVFLYFVSAEMNETLEKKAQAAGARGIVEKPLTSAAIKRICAEYEAAPSRPCKNVLIIDDSVFALEVHAELVRAVGENPITAENGIEAIRLFQEKKPEIVLCDIMMPEMDGYEVFEVLKKIQPGIFFCFVSGEMTDQVKVRCARMGAHGFFQKPIGVATVQSVIRDYDAQKLSRSRLERQPE